MRLFRRSSAKAAAAEAGGSGVPAYYEVWGGLESANRALWFGLWFTATVALLCLIMVRALLSRPPVVIRVSDSGTAQAAVNAGQPPVDAAEVKNFLSLFERFFMGLNVYTCQSDLALAATMMTPDFRQKANDMLKREGVLDELKSNQGRVTVTLTDLKVVRDTPGVIECKVLGNRREDSYKPDGKTGQVVFEDDIILRKVPRSEQSPYGVLVEDFRESVYEDTLAR